MNEELKIGDLVETCQMHPGFITSINGDSVEVFIPTRLNDYTSIYGCHHSIEHCGVHKISTEYAMMLFSFTEEELKKLYEINRCKNWEETVRFEYNKKLKKL